MYVTKRWPTDPIAFNNLGDLYQNYYRDNVKARAIVEAGLKTNPNDAMLKARLEQIPQ